jgi:hypothetical protein
VRPTRGRCRGGGRALVQPLAKRILIIAVVASALDSGGDEGTRMARGTILTAVFPKWQTPEKQNYLLLGLLIMVNPRLSSPSLDTPALSPSAYHHPWASRHSHHPWPLT